MNLYILEVDGTGLNEEQKQDVIFTLCTQSCLCCMLVCVNYMDKAS